MAMGSSKYLKTVKSVVFNAAWVTQYTDSGQIRQKDRTIGSLSHAKFPPFLIGDSRSASYKLQISGKKVQL